MSTTPGPWITRSPNGRIGVYTQSGCKVAAVEAPHMIRALERDGRSGNAYLIAAAPDLLAACKAAYKFLGGLAANPAIGNPLREAIAKAEGKQKVAEKTGDLFDEE